MIKFLAIFVNPAMLAINIVIGVVGGFVEAIKKTYRDNLRFLETL